MPKNRDDWTSISVYSEIKDRLDSLREAQSYDEFFLALCEHYDPSQADDDFEYNHPENDEEEREWKTMSMHKEVYDEIVSLKSDDETFNDLFIQMAEQYNPEKQDA